MLGMLVVGLTYLVDRDHANFVEVFKRLQHQRAPDHRDISSVVVTNTATEQDTTCYEIRVVN